MLRFLTAAFVTLTAILFPNRALACSMYLAPVRSFDPAHYIFLGEIIEVVPEVPYSSGGIGDYAVGFGVRVTEFIYPSRTARGAVQFDVFPLRLTPMCSLMSDTKELRARFPIGSKVRVVAKSATVLSEVAPAGAPARLETSIYNAGSFSRNDLRDDLRTSAARVYDYRTWTAGERQTAADDGLVDSSYGLLAFELRKDLLRLKNATNEAERIAILERLAFYPNVRGIDLPELARGAIRAGSSRTAIEQRWTERLRAVDAAIPRPVSPPEPALRHPALKGLLTYLKAGMSAPDAVRSVVEYLDARSDDEDRLGALVAWVQAGFPELHERGSWKLDSLGVRLAVSRSITYFVGQLPESARGDRYLEILDAVTRDDYIGETLAQLASRYVDGEPLKRSSFALMSGGGASERRRGVTMVCRLGLIDEVVWNRCRDTFVSDADYRVRLSALYNMPPEQQMPSSRREERVTVLLRAFLTDSRKDLRDAAARHLEVYAERAAVLNYPEAYSVLTRLLVTVAQSRDVSIQERLAGLAAKMTTTIPYSANKTIPHEALTLFLETVERKGASRPGADPLLVQLWLDWWQLLMREYSTHILRGR